MIGTALFYADSEYDLQYIVHVYAVNVHIDSPIMAPEEELSSFGLQNELFGGFR